MGIADGNQGMHGQESRFAGGGERLPSLGKMIQREPQLALLKGVLAQL
jgi:hypothetical protein